jgi:hypothetical protein
MGNTSRCQSLRFSFSLLQSDVAILEEQNAESQAKSVNELLVAAAGQQLLSTLAFFNPGVG